MTSTPASTADTKAEQVTQAVSEYRAMKWQLEEELKQVVREKLAVKQSEIDDLVRVMYNADPKHNKAAVARALMTSDRATVDRILARTESAAAVAFELDAPVEQVGMGDAQISYDGGNGQIKIKMNGQRATFDVDVWPENGGIVLTTHDELWNEDYSIRNEIVFLLDGVDIAGEECSPLGNDVHKFLKGKL